MYFLLRFLASNKRSYTTTTNQFNSPNPDREVNLQESPTTCWYIWAKPKGKTPICCDDRWLQTLCTRKHQQQYKAAKCAILLSWFASAVESISTNMLVVYGMLCLPKGYIIHTRSTLRRFWINFDGVWERQAFSLTDSVAATNSRHTPPIGFASIATLTKVCERLCGSAVASSAAWINCRCTREIRPFADPLQRVAMFTINDMYMQ